MKSYDVDLILMLNDLRVKEFVRSEDLDKIVDICNCIKLVIEVEKKGEWYRCGKFRMMYKDKLMELFDMLHRYEVKFKMGL